jgi:segregation and condensation protein B
MCVADPILGQADGADAERFAILEAVLFVTEEPLALAKLQEILGDATAEETSTTIRALAVRMEEEGRGLLVQEVAGGFRLSTKPEVHPWVMKLQQVKPAKLSRAALETLAIIAYRQPITRAEVEAVRGVAIDGVLKTLLERELVRMLGRKPDAGRPMLYGTTIQFLEHFGLRELTDLPTLREINELLGPSEIEFTPGSQGAGAAPPTGADDAGSADDLGSSDSAAPGDAAVAPADGSIEPPAGGGATLGETHGPIEGTAVERDPAINVGGAPTAGAAPGDAAVAPADGSIE